MGEFPNKETQFSSTNQPPNKNKRKPKWKTRLKKLLTENYDEISKAIIDKCKEGDIRHIEFLRNWLYGKPKDTIEHQGDMVITVDIIKDDEES